MEALNKVKTTISGAPLGALAGAAVGILVAKKVGYHHTLMVVSFTVVGAIIGATLGKKAK